MEQMVKCHNCNAENSAGLKFCTNCGNRLGMPCHNCGDIVPPDSRFCPNCAALTGIGRLGKHQDKVESTNHVIYCTNCGIANKSGKKFCTSCGSRLYIICPQCGSTEVLPSGYCPNCGHIVQQRID